jgi:anti-sigma factor RsiW
MDCRNALEHIDDLVDGTLDADAAAALTVHLAGCAGCARERDALLELRRAARALPRSIAPDRDLWPAIAQRTRPRRSIGLPLALAASVAAALIGVVATKFAERALQDPPPTAAPELATASVQGRAQFVAQVVGSDPAVSVQTRAVVEYNLRVIQQALGEIEQALEREPGDANLRQLLIAIHMQESALIERMQRLTVDANRRTDI